MLKDKTGFSSIEYKSSYHNYKVKIPRFFLLVGSQKMAIISFLSCSSLKFSADLFFIPSQFSLKISLLQAKSSKLLYVAWIFGRKLWSKIPDFSMCSESWLYAWMQHARFLCKVK